MTGKTVKPLTKEMIEMIISEWNNNTSVNEMATKLGIGQIRIKNIVKQLNEQYQRDDGLLICPDRSKKADQDVIGVAAAELGFKKKAKE